MPDSPPPPTHAPSAHLRGVTKQRGAVKALDGLNLVLESGRVTALLGPNGAGKSTTVGLLTGRLAPDQGEVRVFGLDPRRAAGRARLGVMLQECGAPRGLTVIEQINLFRGYYSRPLPMADVVALARLEGLERRRCSALSGGQQRRLQFALALCGRPDLIVLDEPTTAMDLETRRALWTTVRAEAARGAAVLLTTHDLEEAEALSDRVVVLDRGRVIADGPPAQFKAGASVGVVKCRTRLIDAALMSLEGVTSVVRNGGLTILLSAAPKATLRALLTADPDLDDLSLTGASLEDALTTLLAQNLSSGGGAPDLEIAA